MSNHQNLTKSRWTLGLILLAVVVLLWVASGFLINDIFESGEYRKPYFVTYLNTGTFTIYLLPSLYRYIRKKSNDQLSSPNASTIKLAGQIKTDSENGERQGLLTPNTSGTDLSNAGRLPEPVPYTVRETAIFSSQFCILWFVANLLSNACLSYTSVSNSTILLSTSSFFTLMIGSLFKVEKITSQKVIALVVSIIGLYLIVATTNSDEDTSTDVSKAWLGNVMALASALVYGLYTTLLKVAIGDDESRINMYLFFGFVGLFNIILLWPVITLFNYIGVETFELPSTAYVWVIVLTNAGTTIVSDFCWALAMLMTSPLVVTVGLSATIPIAILGDMVLKSHYDSFGYYVGAAIMIGAIFRINHLENVENRHDMEEGEHES